MSGNRKTGYNNQRSYNSNGSYKTVYTAGSAAPDYQRAPGRSGSPEKSRSGRPAQQRSPQRRGTYAREARQQHVPRTGTGYAYGAAPAYEPQPRRQEQRTRRPRTKQERMAAERRKHIALRNQRRAAQMNAGSVTFMTALVLVCCLFAVLYIYKGFAVRNTMTRVSDLQEQLTDVKQQNSAKEAELYSGMSLNQIKKDAKKLGMTYAGQDQIIYFTLDRSDYVNDFSTVD